jgi:hypothetical protein
VKFVLFVRSSSSSSNNKNTYPQHAVAFLFDDVLLSRRSEGKEGSKEEHENTLDGSHGDSFFVLVLLCLLRLLCAALQNYEPRTGAVLFRDAMLRCSSQTRVAQASFNTQKEQKERAERVLMHSS